MAEDGETIIDEEENRAVAKIRPLHDRILMKRLEEQEKTRGGIIIPESTPASRAR